MGISPGNLYYHFHGKEPLAMQLLERFRGETWRRCSTRRWKPSWMSKTTGCSYT